MPTKTKPAKKTATSKAAKKPAKTSADAGTKKRSTKAEALQLSSEPAPAKTPGKASAAVPYQTEETTLLLTQLTPGPWQDRTEFPEAYLADLAASIEEHGVLQRLWVRPKDKPGKKGETHDIIAGECRWRAAQQTRHLVVPVKIFHCTPAQAKVLSIIENLQRENLNPLDEAHGFRKLQEQGWSAYDPENPETSIGHKVGKSKTYIYSALKLTELNKTGQAAVRSGELSASVGIRIARIPNKEAQAKALADAVRDGWTDADAADEIARHYMTELKGAPFDLADETLNLDRPSCKKCPFRSGNQKEFFEDMAKGRADICTDPSCFRLKCERSFERRAEAHVAKGGKVMTPEEAEKAGLRAWHSNIGGEWANLDAPCYSLPGAANGKTPRELLDKLIKEQKCGELITHLALANDGSGKHFELMKVKDIEHILLRCGVIRAESKSRGDSERDHQREAKERRKRDAGLVVMQLDAIAKAGEHFGTAATWSPFEAVFLRAIARWLIAERNIEALRHIVNRREIDVKEFKLEADTGNERFVHALEAIAIDAQPAQVTGLICELLASPAYLGVDGDLTRERKIQPLLSCLTLDLVAVYDEALDAVPGGQELKARRALIAGLTARIENYLIGLKEPTARSADIMQALKIEQRDWNEWVRKYDDDEPTAHLESPSYDIWRIKSTAPCI